MRTLKTETGTKFAQVHLLFSHADCPATRLICCPHLYEKYLHSVFLRLLFLEIPFDLYILKKVEHLFQK